MALDFTIVGVPLEAVEELAATLRRRGLTLGHAVGTVLKVEPKVSLSARPYDEARVGSKRAA